uniref:Uncharacterized protein n=1 Tax=Rhipicephalus microplus TaxID=6941 RepID=A0A6G5AEX7_RHIMP
MNVQMLKIDFPICSLDHSSYSLFTQVYFTTHKLQERHNHSCLFMVLRANLTSVYQNSRVLDEMSLLSLIFIFWGDQETIARFKEAAHLCSACPGFLREFVAMVRFEQHCTTCDCRTAMFTRINCI